DHHIGVDVDAERDGLPGEARHTLHHQGVGGIGDQEVVPVGTLENLGLRVGDVLDGPEVAEVCRTDIEPHANVRLGYLDQPPDLTGATHAEFDDSHGGARAQLEQRQR